MVHVCTVCPDFHCCVPPFFRLCAFLWPQGQVQKECSKGQLSQCVSYCGSLCCFSHYCGSSFFGVRWERIYYGPFWCNSMQKSSWVPTWHCGFFLSMTQWWGELETRVVHQTTGVTCMPVSPCMLAKFCYKGCTKTNVLLGALGGLSVLGEQIAHVLLYSSSREPSNGNFWGGISDINTIHSSSSKAVPTSQAAEYIKVRGRHKEAVHSRRWPPSCCWWRRADVVDHNGWASGWRPQAASQYWTDACWCMPAAEGQGGSDPSFLWRQGCLPMCGCLSSWLWSSARGSPSQSGHSCPEMMECLSAVALREGRTECLMKAYPPWETVCRILLEHCLEWNIGNRTENQDKYSCVARSYGNMVSTIPNNMNKFIFYITTWKSIVPAFYGQLSMYGAVLTLLSWTLLSIPFVNWSMEWILLELWWHAHCMLPHLPIPAWGVGSDLPIGGWGRWLRALAVVHHLGSGGKT